MRMGRIRRSCRRRRACLPTVLLLVDSSRHIGGLFTQAARSFAGCGCARSNAARLGRPLPFHPADEDGNSDDFVSTMKGVTFYYHFFSSDSYRRILGEIGFRLVDVHGFRDERVLLLGV